MSDERLNNKGCSLSLMEYNKLVRDKIPEILKKKGLNPTIHIASEEEYKVKLKEKLQEEVNEFLESNNTEELADILEVIYAICENEGLSIEDLEKLRKSKSEERGSLKNKIILDSSE